MMNRYLESLTRDVIESSGYIFDSLSPMVITMNVVGLDNKFERLLIRDNFGKEIKVDGFDNIKEFINNLNKI